MARMIPPQYDASYSSPGEQMIFDEFESAPGCERWIVFHSLDLAEHKRQTQGEIDFLIVIPGKGVLVLEVKSHNSVRRVGGRWLMGADPPSAKSPFKQASEAMHSVKKRIFERDPDLKGIVFFSAVAFPNAPFSEESVEWHDWQYLNAIEFNSKPVSELLEGVMDKAREHIRKSPSSHSWFDSRSRTPTRKQCERLVHILRPDFECYESPKSRARKLDAELKKYTNEQFVALDSIGRMPRVVLEGPAGTGKTLLAIEGARRGGIAGRRALFLCFNHLLGEWLEEQTSDLKPGVICRTLHSHMRSIAKIDVPPSPDGDFWALELPQAASEALIEDGSGHNIFDELIVDEAQDMLGNDNYLDFLDLSLKGGFKDGYWRFFGDFEKQAIFGDLPEDYLEPLKSRAGNPSDLPLILLSRNCRNTPRIARLIRLFGGLDPFYSGIMRPDDGFDPSLRFYESDEQQRELLIQTLEQLYTQGFKGDIVVLSPRGDKNCIAAGIDAEPWKDRLRPLRKAEDGHVGYSSIHAYKGLENAAVIVTDIDRYRGEYTEKLLYVAITRATSRLDILASADMETRLRELYEQA